jgi:hypothetical protein
VAIGLSNTLLKALSVYFLMKKESVEVPQKGF